MRENLNDKTSGKLKQAHVRQKLYGKKTVSMVSILGELGQTFYIAKLTPIVVTTSN